MLTTGDKSANSIQGKLDIFNLYTNKYTRLLLESKEIVLGMGKGGGGLTQVDKLYIQVLHAFQYYGKSTA